ncbi:hypothetical protein EHQ12_18095 [Leptospira gomenensis]|uniref:Lipoprotein n=1 Tax=Leptospira gomenensis TaxID=2484974 RepID=A0A5F1YDE0_9LEPT|nr:ErpY-like lipoprotein [Leptospira gomenensis]TGK33245.1 hypothetical protein EHQ12_18095 [Leptospira gomenensis]TGK35523.1 hypothetical protein EHQ17_06230 [Leptospira gomenensis]TGK40846.1 hypothetical protein EHQ07_17190 [Leptospira gomenensis]TGK61137.1 hypothetical protein EHQ13_09725 [Leptospira gomenensis]
MKKRNLPIVWIATICCIYSLGIGCKQDPIEYNNKIMDVLNGSIADMDALNAAMEKEDYSGAENLRKAWETKLNQSVETLKSIGDFKGDAAFKNAGIQGLEIYRNVATQDYKRLIELRSLGDKANVTEADRLLDQINQNFEKAANLLNTASDAFAKEHTTQ